MKKVYLTLATMLLLTACPQKSQKGVEVSGTMAEQEIELSEASFSDLENWNQDNLGEFIEVFANNCKRLEKVKTPNIADSKIKISTADYLAVCQKFFKDKPQDTKAFRKFIESSFTPFLVSGNGNAEGKFTSYYESQIRASKTRQGKYQYPVYGKPTDLVEINLRDFDPSLPAARLVGRVNGQKMIPYYTRAEIENNPLGAPVLLWGDSQVDIHVMQIQGSAVAMLDDGSELRIGYADSNGRPFRGIGSILLGENLIKPGKADMINIKHWLEANPDKADALMQKNQRYIFHRIIEADGPIGAMGIPLTAGRSMAVDRKYVPLGAILWLNTNTPDHKPLNKLVAAQDIGSAIKGAVRGDYFWGSGGDEILALAGKMNSAGHYYILIPKEMSGGKR